jgi:hypothetical protein
MKRRGEGFLLVTVLFVMVVVMILALGTSFTSLIDRQVASRQRVGTEAYYLAQAGLDRLKTALFLELAEQARTVVDVCGFPPFDVDIGGGIVLSPGILSQPIPFEPITNGWYELRFERSGGYFVLTAVGYLAPTVGAAERTAQSTIQLVATAGEGPSGVWDNAIFAREFSRSGSGDLTGTIAAYGSVHIVNGDVLLEEDEALGGTGSSGIFNNYAGRGTQTNVQAAAELALGVGRRDPLDLCSRLKVAQGDVRVQSNANRIGAPGDIYDGDEWIGPSTPGARIESIEGVYMRGDVVDQNGNPLSSASQREIYTRSGVAGYEGFDLQFPDLEVGFPSGIGLLPATCELIVGTTLRIPPAAAGVNARCEATDGAFIEWDDDLKVLIVEGKVSVPAGVDVVFATREGSPSVRVDAVRYQGMGEIRVGTKTNDVLADNTGSIMVLGAILPRFPDRNYLDHGLALVTAGDILVDVTSANSTVSALMYAQRDVVIEKQPEIVGAVIGRRTDVAQVPKVLYHPDIGLLAEFLCLIGSNCDLGAPGNEGPWSEVSTEVR